MNRLRKDMEIALAPLLKEQGFTKKGLTWISATPDVFRVLHLQKSAHGETFYLRLGVFLRKLEPNMKSVTEVSCHGRFGLPKNVPASEAKRFEDSLENFDPAGLNTWKFEVIKTTLETYVIPFLLKLETEGDVYEQLYKKGIVFDAESREYLEKKFG